MILEKQPERGALESTKLHARLIDTAIQILTSLKERLDLVKLEVLLAERSPHNGTNLVTGD
ncbi:MAG: hypothetical protein V7731_01170 [Amphritea sp.]